MKTCINQLLSWSQPPKISLSLIKSAKTFCPIEKHSQFNVIGGANEEPHYPRVKRLARLKPWAPWVMADHYKKEKKKHYQQNSSAKRNPKKKR
jgi:hypothetical protein